MADQDPSQGNSREPYKMVMLATLWVESSGFDHHTITNLAKQIILHELDNTLGGATFKIENTEYVFQAEIDSIDFIERNDIN
jgi:hypothetical protein|tara:strand:+ start:85 stop:330 length:246 start_codon:yes stop_codon:yes gene_type:complete